MENYLKKELYELIKKEDYIFEFLQNSSLDGLWYWDLENMENEWMNERFWTILGYDPAEKPHKASAWQDIINPDDLKLAVENATKHLQDPTHPYDQVVRYTHKNNSTVWIRCRGLAIRDENGKPLRMLGAHHNITDIMEQEAIIKEQNLELQELNDTKDKLFSIIAHDLRSPFSAILGFSEIISKRVQEQNYDDLDKYSNYVHKAAQQSFNLLNNLLEWSRIQTNRTPFNAKDLNLIEITSHITELLNANIKEKNIKLTVDIPTDLRLHADKDMIETVIRNLITNAIKYTYPAGEINITATQNELETEFNVKDNGIGMSEDTATNIFKIGHSNSEPGTNDERGTGLGLILCKEFMDRHQGTISVESQEGKGSTFKITIPRKITTDTTT